MQRLTLVHRQFARPQEALVLEQDRLAPPGPGQVQLRVLASPINPMDQLRVRGHYPLLPELPGTPGSEACAEVIELGPEVSHLHLGQRVLLPIRAGGWCSHLNHDATSLAPVPATASPVHASMLRVNGATAHVLLEGLDEGAWVLSAPGGGGVGQALAQLAHRRGVNLVAVVRDLEDEPWLESIGATAVVEAGPGLKKRVREAVGKVRFARAFDGVGGATTEELGRCLGSGGTVHHYGAMSRHAPALGVADAIFRDVRLQGFWLYRHNQNQGLTAELERLRVLADLDLRFRLGDTFPLPAWQDALTAPPTRKGRRLFVME